MPDTDEPVLIGRVEVARHAGVGRAAVSNWESRYENFPRPALTRGRETFDATAVAAWLDGRRIPSNMLLDGESEGQDYGSRFRRSLGLAHPTGGEPEPATTAESPGAQAAQWLLHQLQGADFPAAALWLAFLVHLRDRDPSEWARVRDQTATTLDWHALEDAWRRALRSPLYGTFRCLIPPAAAASIARGLRKWSSSWPRRHTASPRTHQGRPEVAHRWPISSCS